jgi:hypothetical protein
MNTSTPQPNDEPVTQEEFLKFRKAVIRRLRTLEGLVSDAFQAISDGDDNARETSEEALNHSQRAERAVRRLKKEYDEHEHE